jgi:hypothetical protein
VDPQVVAHNLPEALRNLSSVLNFTIGGIFCTQATALVDLLDKKVLDPRMLRGLLRHQGAVLTHLCFSEPLKAFRFEAGRAVPAIFSKLPLDVSLAALLIEAAALCTDAELPSETHDTVYVRRAVRGQNLDRAGLGAQHMKVIGCLDKPESSERLAKLVGMNHGEVRRILYALVRADWVETDTRSRARTVLALETDATGAQQLNELLGHNTQRYVGKVVRDRLGMQLLLKRSRPDAVLLALDSGENWLFANDVRQSKEFGDSKLVGILPPSGTAHHGTAAAEDPSRLHLDAVLRRPYNSQQLSQTLDRLFHETGSLEPALY